MKKLEFRIDINSPVERVYSSMIDKDYFNEIWPQALEKLKFICEINN